MHTFIQDCFLLKKSKEGGPRDPLWLRTCLKYVHCLSKVLNKTFSLVYSYIPTTTSSTRPWQLSTFHVCTISGLFILIVTLTITLSTRSLSIILEHREGGERGAWYKSHCASLNFAYTPVFPTSLAKAEMRS